MNKSSQYAYTFTANNQMDGQLYANSEKQKDPQKRKSQYQQTNAVDDADFDSCICHLSMIDNQTNYLNICQDEQQLGKSQTHRSENSPILEDTEGEENENKRSEMDIEMERDKLAQ